MSFIKTMRRNEKQAVPCLHKVENISGMFVFQLFMAMDCKAVSVF
jgi:hypothetical protein